jgi:hypothetical protein
MDEAASMKCGDAKAKLEAALLKTRAAIKDIKTATDNISGSEAMVALLEMVEKAIKRTATDLYGRINAYEDACVKEEEKAVTLATEFLKTHTKEDFVKIVDQVTGKPMKDKADDSA